MDEVLAFMVNKDWEKDEKASRKIYLHKIARESSKNDDPAQKIGGMLIYNQIIEQLLREIVIGSIAYVKAEIWPAEVQLDFKFNKMPLGNLISSFEQYATKETNRQVIIEELRYYSEKRNAVVHKLFEISDIENLLEEIVEYDAVAEEIIGLLLQYCDDICSKFYDLENRVDFDILFESFGDEED